MSKRVAVIGSGSWGTAISHVLGLNGCRVSLWSHNPAIPEVVNAQHSNPLYLTGVSLPNVVCTTSYREALNGVESVVVATPSKAARTVAENILPLIDFETPVVILSKGFEMTTGLLMSDVYADVLGNTRRVAVLSGPNHAEDVGGNLPAATVVASSNKNISGYFQDLFTNCLFRVYTSDDVAGVEICGGAKNVIAIACGMLHGLGLGDSAGSSLLARGLAEISRLVIAYGGKEKTCMGLAGVGDLVATCSSRHSRNRALGEFLAAGKTLADFESETHMIAEGAAACKVVTELAARKGIDMPIAEAVSAVLWDGAKPDEMIEQLMRRPLRAEF